MLTRMFEVERNIDSVVCKESVVLWISLAPFRAQETPLLVHPNFQHGR